MVIAIDLITSMVIPAILTEIMTLMQDPEASVNRGIRLLTALMALKLIQMLIDMHNFNRQHQIGEMSALIVQTMTVKKQLRLNSATSKNHDEGQIHQVRGATHVVSRFFWEMLHMVYSPIWVLYCTFKLFKIIGCKFIFSLGLMVFCYYFDHFVRSTITDLQYAQEVNNERRVMLASESFQNIKTLKLYGWDEYFKEEILKLRAKQTAQHNRIRNSLLPISFMWSFLPNLMSTVSFAVFFAFGNSLELSSALEMMILFQWMRDDFNKVMNIKEATINMRISLMRIEGYLGQDEVLPGKIVRSARQETDLAVKINN